MFGFTVNDRPKQKQFHKHTLADNKIKYYVRGGTKNKTNETTKNKHRRQTTVNTVLKRCLVGQQFGRSTLRFDILDFTTYDTTGFTTLASCDIETNKEPVACLLACLLA